MIIVRLEGGLGNQMFQYAFGRYLAHRNKTRLLLDTEALGYKKNAQANHVTRHYDLDVFKIDPDIATADEARRLSHRFSNDFLNRLANKVLGYKKTVFIEPHFHFSQKAYELTAPRYVIGYWQSPKYFSTIEQLIRADFSFRQPIGEKAAKMLKQIEQANSICVNVRRGDFVTNTFHGSFGTDYFERAESIFASKVPDPVYFVFSDDIEWCQANLMFSHKAIFVTHDYAGPKFRDYLELMSACRHYIIPNSSFAWWAVWLNQNPEKIVVAPQKWFSDATFNTCDLLPSEWLRV